MFGRQFAVIHVTDGAPRSGDDVRAAGCATWQEYAALRRRELEKALDAAGGSDYASLCLGYPDQEAVFHVPELAVRLAEMFERLCPAIVFTHAYEGGHPDHDASAAAVHAAVGLLKAPCKIAEFTGYHAGANGMECECFLEDGVDIAPRPLTYRESQWKRALLNCYPSQARVLAQFPLRHEPTRPAPLYDFTRAPHDGALYYERFDWGMNPAEWRTLARRAFRDLGMSCVC